MTIQALKGFKDILPDETPVWQRLEATARDLFHRFGFAEIKVPILEKTELFQRSIGETTDIVEKEMYTFTDRNGASITMRPEGTASVLRAFIEHGLHLRQSVCRLYTIGPMFRRERPQKGRLRQFHQVSVEALGSDKPRLDVEVMAMAWQFLQELGLTASLQVNSLGCPDCRPTFNQALREFLAGRAEQLCEDCQRRRLINPLRVLDCKSRTCQEHYRNAPTIVDYLCADCRTHFGAVEQGLAAIPIPYEVNPLMVRGLDYYTRTTFELVSGALGAQSAVGAGGRYDGLVKELGGPDLSGIGFAMGMERLVLLLAQQAGVVAAGSAGLDLFVVALGEEAASLGFRLTHQLRGLGLRAAMDYEGRGLKAQMKAADKAGARLVLILGEDELRRQEGLIKDMLSGSQARINLPAASPESWPRVLAERIATINRR